MQDQGDIRHRAARRIDQRDQFRHHPGQSLQRRRIELLQRLLARQKIQLQLARSLANGVALFRFPGAIIAAISRTRARSYNNPNLRARYIRFFGGLPRHCRRRLNGQRRRRCGFLPLPGWRHMTAHARQQFGERETCFQHVIANAKLCRPQHLLFTGLVADKYHLRPASYFAGKAAHSLQQRPPSAAQRAPGRE